jgi:LPS export ABC transporter protein LptC
MINKKITYYLSAILFLGLLFSSCQNNFKDIQKIHFTEFTPSTEAEDFNLKYTDSGRIKSILISKQMLDYSSVAYPFAEFPKGIDLTMFDANGKKTFVKSNYGINFKSTQIIDLQGNVTITNEVGQKMVTEQLYYDQKSEWFYTEKSFVFTSPDGTLTGMGVDFSKDFKIMNTQKLSGQLNNSK